jgi:hypothetical protein
MNFIGNAGKRSVTLARLRGKELFEFVGHTVHFLGFRQRITLDGDIRPDLGIFGINFQPLIETWLSVRLDGLGRTFRLADTAIDAFVGMNDQKILALIKAVDGADFNAIGILAANTIISHDIRHEALQ